MKSLNRTSRGQTSARDRRSRVVSFIRKAPIVAGLILASFALPSISQAQETKHQCTVKSVTGPMKRFQSHKVRRRKITGLKLFVPTFDRQKHLQITVPDSYINALVLAASKLKQEERQPLVTSSLQRTVEAGIKSIGRSSSSTFTCGSFAPTASVPLALTPPPPAKTSPAASKRPSKTVDTSKAPLPVKLKGGSGSSKNPFVIEVSVAHTSSGKQITSSTFHSTAVGQGGEGTYKTYFKLQYVTAKAEPNYRTSTKKLANRIAHVAARKATEHVRGHHGQTTLEVSASALRTPIQSMLKRAAANPQFSGTIGEYLKSSTTSRRRVMR